MCGKGKVFWKTFGEKGGGEGDLLMDALLEKKIRSIKKTGGEWAFINIYLGGSDRMFGLKGRGRGRRGRGLVVICSKGRGV